MTRTQSVTRNIEKVIALCNEMLELANVGEGRLEEDCSVFYSALRDSAYKIRRLAKNELIRFTNGDKPSSNNN